MPVPHSSRPARLPQPQPVYRGGQFTCLPGLLVIAVTLLIARCPVTDVSCCSVVETLLLVVFPLLLVFPGCSLLICYVRPLLDVVRLRTPGWLDGCPGVGYVTVVPHVPRLRYRYGCWPGVGGVG